MTGMAHESAQSGATILDRWIRVVGEWWDAWRAAQADGRLVAVETRFFDAYCRGGTRQWEPLAIDYSFLSRPRVRHALRRAERGEALEISVLEDEFLTAEPDGDPAVFRANAHHLSLCLAGLA